MFPFVSSDKLNINVDTNYSVRIVQLTNNGGTGYDLSSNNGSVLTVAGTGNNYTPGFYTVTNSSSVTQTINVNMAVSSGGVLFAAHAAPMTINSDIALGNSSSAFGAYADATSKLLTLNGSLSNTSTEKSVTFNNSYQGGSSIGATIRVNGLSTYNAYTAIYDAAVTLGADAGTTSTAGALGQTNKGIAMGQANINSHPALLMGGAYTISRGIYLTSPDSSHTLTAAIGGTTTATSHFDGTLRLGGAGLFSNIGDATGVNIVSATGGTVIVAGDIITGGNANAQLATVNINPNGGAWNNGTAWTGTGKVVFTSNNNNYAGATTVTAGTLQVDGTLTAGGGTVTVNSGAFLGGNGTINRQIVNNGSIAPGSSIGMLTVDDVLFASGSQLLIELDNGGSSDNLTVNNSLDITQANLVLSGVTDGSIYIIASYGSLAGSEFASVSGLPGGYLIDYNYQNANQIALVQIPEPAAVSLLAMSGMLLAFSRNMAR